MAQLLLPNNVDESRFGQFLDETSAAFLNLTEQTEESISKLHSFFAFFDASHLSATKVAAIVKLLRQV